MCCARLRRFVQRRQWARDAGIRANSATERDGQISRCHVSRRGAVAFLPLPDGITPSCGLESRPPITRTVTTRRAHRRGRANNVPSHRIRFTHPLHLLPQPADLHSQSRDLRSPPWGPTSAGARPTFTTPGTYRHRTCARNWMTAWCLGVIPKATAGKGTGTATATTRAVTGTFWAAGSTRRTATSTGAAAGSVSANVRTGIAGGRFRRRGWQVPRLRRQVAPVRQHVG